MPGQWRLSRIGSVAATLLLLANCAVGPDFQRPSAPETAGYTREPLAAQTVAADVAGGAAQRLVEGLDIPGQWWTLFRSPPLNALIEQSLKANPNLEAAVELRALLDRLMASSPGKQLSQRRAAQ